VIRYLILCVRWEQYYHYGADEDDGYGETDGGGPGVDNGVANISLEQQSPLYDSPNPRKTTIVVNDIPYSTYRALIYYVRETSLNGDIHDLLILLG
jgi:hypothetical protein